MKNKVIRNLFGKDMIQVIENLLKRYVADNYDEQMLYKELKDFNESVRTVMYLITLEKNSDDIAFRINRVNKLLNDERKENFLVAVENNETDRFLSMLGKGDKISLLSDLGLDVDVRGRAEFTKEQKKYFEILSNSIMEDQELDKRDGIDKFITYKKGEKEA